VNAPANTFFTGREELDQLIETVGWDGMLAVVLCYAGIRKTIPKKPDGWMVAKLGEAIAQQVCALFAGCQLQMPLSMRREALILRMDAQKPRPSINEIADTLVISYRTVHRVINASARSAYKTQIPLAIRDELPLFSYSFDSQQSPNNSD
jgi:hypothetical protein